jgi:hypothetical protein
MVSLHELSTTSWKSTSLIAPETLKMKPLLTMYSFSEIKQQRAMIRNLVAHDFAKCNLERLLPNLLYRGLD